MGGPLGTLIVVVLKARNLPNKQRIGKQDPYATLTYLSHRKRTKTDKRGGQHPVWDDELRFDIYENAKDVMQSASVATTSTGGVAPIKSRDPAMGAGGSPGVKEIRVAVYADDPRDPDLIGEGKVDLTDTLKKGEFDDWVTITNKGKYQGEVYLEMTFYSAKPPPEKHQAPSMPSRAGVFEAASPGSGLVRPSGIKTDVNGGSKSSSPLRPSTNQIDPRVVPASLRVGAPPRSSRNSTGNLPLPGEPESPHHASLNTRQRSSGSLSMPRPQHSQESSASPSRSPSRNQSTDQPNSLVNAMNTLAISGSKPPLHHASSDHDSAGHVQPSELHLPYVPPQQRPHRHSFSGHSHPPLGNNPLQHSYSDNAQLPTHAAHQHPDQYPTSTSNTTQPSRVPNTPRRPLPIPGGDPINRPTSAWGDYSNQAGQPNPHSNNSVPAPQQLHQQPIAPWPPSSDHENRLSVSQNGPVAYPPPQHSISPAATPLNHPPPPIPNPPIQMPYSEPPRHYFPAPPAPPSEFMPNLQHPGHMTYNHLPPPPPNQAPVPIHEVFASATSRPLPPMTNNQSFHPPPNPYHHPPPALAGPHSHSVQTPPRPLSRIDVGYPFEGATQDPINQPHQTPTYNPYTEKHMLGYNFQAAPPPPPPHLQQQLQYHPSYEVPPANSQMYYQPNQNGFTTHSAQAYSSDNYQHPVPGPVFDRSVTPVPPRPATSNSFYLNGYSSQIAYPQT